MLQLTVVGEEDGFDVAALEWTNLLHLKKIQQIVLHVSTVNKLEILTVVGVILRTAWR